LALDIDNNYNHIQHNSEILRKLLCVKTFKTIIKKNYKHYGSDNINHINIIKSKNKYEIFVNANLKINSSSNEYHLNKMKFMSKNKHELVTTNILTEQISSNNISTEMSEKILKIIDNNIKKLKHEHNNTEFCDL